MANFKCMQATFTKQSFISSSNESCFRLTLPVVIVSHTKTLFFQVIRLGVILDSWLSVSAYCTQLFYQQLFPKINFTSKELVITSKTFSNISDNQV